MGRDWRRSSVGLEAVERDAQRSKERGFISPEKGAALEGVGRTITMPGRKKQTKFDRCLRDVKRKGMAVSPGAVCQKSVGNVGHRQRKKTDKKKWAAYIKTAHGIQSGFGAKKKTAGKRSKSRKTRGNPGSRKNPVESATQAYRDFHGKDPEKIIETETSVHYHGVLAGLGKLKFLEVKRDVDGGITVINFGPGTYLTENEKRTQLFISGGDQSVNLRDFGISKPHELELLGEAVKVGYFTEKLHLVAKDGGKALYVHKFSSPRPTIIYDTRNTLLSFAGGGYSIPSEGIDG
jgi:hypothetical protein